MKKLSKPPLKLNLGCGLNKIPGFIGIDIEPSVKPDIICDFIKTRVPYKDNTVDEIILFHTIEHINKRLHSRLLSEVWRVLKPDGLFLVSYPEFWKCATNWKINYKGQKEFWEATIFGRQLFPSDFHVCVMHTPDFVGLLRESGFYEIKTKNEPQYDYNTVVQCIKGLKPPTYQDQILNDMLNTKFKKQQKAGV